MDKNAIKKYAVWARRELISRVSQRAALYEITDKGFGDASADSVLGRVMSAEEKRQRQALITQIREKGYEQVMEEIAYTWFNRFIALRFMEVNGYLPSRVRVFTDDENNFKPQILAEAINMELDGLDMEKVYALKNANDDDALFKYMIIVQCNALSSILPGMFQRISDYTELLFPDNLLREGSVIEQMVSMIPEEDWTDQVQIIGWLYQYYNTEPKDKVFAALKKNIKISKENIPAATQLFTPDWIVRYMVENSLGRLWLEGHPNDELKASWKYYLDEAEQEPDVQTKLAEIRKEYAAMKPEDILAIDPCQGSGHILTYMFDVLVQIYESYGYTAREAASSIVEHNIWGLDIDDRAAQLAYFSVMMKARQYDRRFFSRGIQPHVYAIQESNNLDPNCIEYFVDGRKELKTAMDTLVKELHDAKEYGSILNVTQVNFNALYSRFEEIQQETAPGLYSYHAIDTLLPFVQVAQALAQKYHVVATNPPYLSSGGMSPKLIDYTKDNYPHSKADLFAVFIERCGSLCVKNGLQTMITQHSWMFLTSFEKLREKLTNRTLLNMIHLGARAFEEIGGEVVQTTSFVFLNAYINQHKGVYARLLAPTTQSGKESLYLKHTNEYHAEYERFSMIPGSPVAYWIGQRLLGVFENKKLYDYATVQEGLKTADNDRFIRYWHEVDFSKTNICGNDTNAKWIKHTKGGQFRRWYGNNDSVLNYENDGFELRHFKKASLTGTDNYFKPNITWTRISTGQASFRYTPAGAIPNMAGLSLYCTDIYYFIALLNSHVVGACLSIMNPTINYPPGTIGKIPVRYDENVIEKVRELAKKCISIAKEDYDSFEESWDFRCTPLVGEKTISESFIIWEKACAERFEQLKKFEEEINTIFAEVYGVADEIPASVDANNISVTRANLQREIRGFISYAVGCMFGRYSLDVSGLVYAGGIWDASKYTTFLPDKDAIIPITDDEYFEDDIIGRFVSFVETVYGKERLEENLRFIADALGGKGSPREVIRNYFINDFYTDHLKVYQKRPIYWLFDSGKKNGFKCLIYMHRYQPDTIARIRTDYVHEQQSRYRTAIADLESRIASAGTGERVKLSKQLGKLQDQAEELRVYEEKIHHLADQMIRIDLDDGVKHNYAIFQDVLAKIK